MGDDNKVIEIMLDDIKQIKCDVRELLTWKSKLVGVIVGVSGLMTLLYNVIVPIIFK